MIKLLQVAVEPSANQYLPFPFKVGETVEYKGELDKSIQPETFRKQFCKIYRMKLKRTETVAKKDFKKLGNWDYQS